MFFLGGVKVSMCVLPQVWDIYKKRRLGQDYTFRAGCGKSGYGLLKPENPDKKKTGPTDPVSFFLSGFPD